jgi:hypothetical protein
LISVEPPTHLGDIVDASPNIESVEDKVGFYQKKAKAYKRLIAILPKKMEELAQKTSEFFFGN